MNKVAHVGDARKKRTFVLVAHERNTFIDLFFSLFGAHFLIGINLLYSNANDSLLK